VSTSPSPTVVLVHGAWGHPGDWDDVVAALDGAGLEAAVADLPTMRDPGATVVDDVAHVRELVLEVGGPTVLCGHSYGGMVITGVGAQAPVRELVYLAALVPDEGESMDDLTGGGPTTSSPGMEVRPDGSTLLLGWADRSWDYPPEALDRMARHPRRPFAAGGRTVPVEAAGWRERPTTYVLAERDASLPAALQRRMAERCDRLVELDSGHMVALEHPQQVARILVDRAGAA
jgi:pimeloyl-ACP methyl ester carboxylesterase